MSLNDWASPFPADNAPSGNSNAVNNKRRDKTRNSTIKRKFTGPKQIESMMKLQDALSGDDDDDDGSGLASFEPLAPPALTQVPSVTDQEQKQKPAKMSSGDEKVTTAAFNNMTPQEGYTNYIPYTTQQSNQGMLQHNDNVMLEKINYMIHLLEDQKDEKTGHVAEELILYTFLGVFVIFVLDSFVKNGKYSR
jgi:hypothetical protein